MTPVVGPVRLPRCAVCGRGQVRVRRFGRDPFVLCLACDGGPLVEQALAQLDDDQRRALDL